MASLLVSGVEFPQKTCQTKEACQAASTTRYQVSQVGRVLMLPEANLCTQKTNGLDEVMRSTSRLL